MTGRMPGGATGGAFGLAYRGLVRRNGRGLCPVCGKAHASCDSPAQPAMAYPPLDTRTVPLRPELRMHLPEEREPAMPLVRSFTERPQMALGDYTSDRRLYLNARGEVVEAKSPDAVTLLVAEGGTVPAARARELGLMSEEQKEQAAPAAPRTTYVVGGAGPDDPGAFYDDGTPNTPAGNEGYSDVQSRRSDDREKHLANAQQVRTTEAGAPAMEAAGARRVDSTPSGRNPRAGGSMDATGAPASQDKNQDNGEAGATGDDASMSGEEELRRKGLESGENGAKSEAPAEDKAQAGPGETKGARGPRSGRGANGK